MKIGDRVEVVDTRGISSSLRGSKGHIRKPWGRGATAGWVVSFEGGKEHLYEWRLKVIDEVSPKLTVKTTSAAYMLKLIVKFLNRQDDQALLLWDILSALRGPDNENWELKHRTTNRLRYTIGMRSGSGYLPVVISENGNVDIRKDDFVEGKAHFKNHMAHALDALEIIKGDASWLAKNAGGTPS